MQDWAGFYKDPDSLRVASFDEIGLRLFFLAEVNEIISPAAQHKVAVRFRDHSAQLPWLLADPLQETLYREVVEYCLLNTFPAVFKIHQPATLRAKEARIRQLYVRSFIKIHSNRHILSHILLFIHGFLAFRKFYQVFREKREWLLSNNVKTKICSDLNRLALGVEVSDTYVEKALLKIFGKVDLLGRREKAEEERRKLIASESIRKQRERFIVVDIKQPKPRNQEQAKFLAQLGELIQGKSRNISREQRSAAVSRDQTREESRIGLNQLSSSMSQFLKVRRGHSKFKAKSYRRQTDHVFIMRVQPQKQSSSAQPAQPMRLRKKQGIAMAVWTKRLQTLRQHQVQNIFQKQVAHKPDSAQTRDFPKLVKVKPPPTQQQRKQVRFDDLTAEEPCLAVQKEQLFDPMRKKESLFLSESLIRKRSSKNLIFGPKHRRMLELRTDSWRFQTEK